MTSLLEMAEEEGIEVCEIKLPCGLKGFYCNGIIALNKSIETNAERRCILAEELGHYYNTIGDILNMKINSNKKQEQRAREWAFEKLVPFNELVITYDNGYKNVYELAEYFDVTEDFMNEAILYYQRKYGRYLNE